MKTGQLSVPLERPYIESWDTDGKTLSSAPLLYQLPTVASLSLQKSCSASSACDRIF